MIQYNQLKSGNLAFFENEKVMIQSIYFNDRRTDVMFYRQTLFQTIEDSWATIEKFTSIPLNKNILMQLGFKDSFDKQKETIYYGYKFDKSFFITELEGCFKLFCHKLKWKVATVSNVHELQNLVYLIKKIELPIKNLIKLDIKEFTK